MKVSHAAQSTPVRRGTPAVTSRELTRFFIPLVIQAASQSLTYPLVASVASRGPGGPLNLAGLAQANAILFLLGTLGAGLLTAGLVHAKTREGYRKYCQLNFLITAVVVLIMALLSLPGPAHWWYHALMGLPASIERPATQAMWMTVVLQLLFFLRNPYQVTLYNYAATGLASTATIARIAGTVLLIPLFTGLGLVGPVWAVVVQALAVAVELLLSWWFARPFLRRLPSTHTVPPTIRALLGFTLPLSAGGVLLALSGLLMARIIVLAPDPARMLQAFYLASGLANPAAFAASRVQTVVIEFLGRSSPRQLFTFTLVSGALLGVIPLLFLLPVLADFYYAGVQNCPPALFPLVQGTACGLLLHPLLLALRSYQEGIAALLNRPLAILAGQAAYFVALTGTALLCLRLLVPGNLLPAVSLLVANTLAAVMVYFAIRRRTPAP